MTEKLNGIWIGENATVAIIDDFRISFLCIRKDFIVSVLHHHVLGTVGVVYGRGTKFDAKTVVSAKNLKNPDSGLILSNSNDADHYIVNHSKDTIEYDEINAKLVYTMFDGMKFDLSLAEKIEMKDFEKTNEIDNSLTIAQRMALWGVIKRFEYSNVSFDVEIITQKYSILFNFWDAGKGVYCRVGQNGYCEKGRAMLPTICIRHNQVYMIENNMLSIKEYKPMEECFVENGCAFPSDGGWYWSIKEVTDDIITVNGCNGDIYKTYRKK